MKVSTAVIHKNLLRLDPESATSPFYNPIHLISKIGKIVGYDNEASVLRRIVISLLILLWLTIFDLQPALFFNHR